MSVDFWSKFGNFCHSALCNYNLLPDFLSLQHSQSNAHTPNQCKVKRKHRGLGTGQKSVFKFLSKFEDTMALSVFVLSQIVFAILILIKLFWNFWSKKSCPNPFAVDDRKPRKQYITDQR